MEYVLRIKGVEDMVIISSRMIELLIPKVTENPDRELTVNIKDLMPEEYTGYLMKVINTNRHYGREFQYGYIMEDPVSKRQVFEIIRSQLKQMYINNNLCFEKIELLYKDGAAGLDVICDEPFFWACEDSSATFIYQYPNGLEELLVIECKGRKRNKNIK